MAPHEKQGFARHVVREVAALFAQRGNSNYGGEAVTQLEHALQAATFAEQEQATPQLITAALLHDVGHLLHDLPEDAPDQGLDDRHEALAAKWLGPRFPASVTAPVALHVDAKRYLCAVESEYFDQLSPPSVQSLHLQGGPLSTDEVARFQTHAYYPDAVQLRRWDDRAKIPHLTTPDLEHFLRIVEQAVGEPSAEC